MTCADADGRRHAVGMIPIAVDGAVLTLPRTLEFLGGRLRFGAAPAVWSLHDDARRVDLPAANVTIGGPALLLPAVDALGSHVHLRVSVTMPAGGATAVEVSFFGGSAKGGSTIVLAGLPGLPPAPPPPSCSANAIVNNSYFGSGVYHYATQIGKQPASGYGPDAAAQCRDVCCASPTCAAWTLTETFDSRGRPNVQHPCQLRGPGAFLLQCSR